MLCPLISGTCVFFFCSEILVSSRRHISELLVSGFGRPMPMFRGEVDRIGRSAVYVRDGFLGYR